MTDKKHVNWEGIAEEWMAQAVGRETDLLKILYVIAESGAILPVVFASAIRLIPGYDPKKAPLLENQWFGSDGFPIECSEKGIDDG